MLMKVLTKIEAQGKGGVPMTQFDGMAGRKSSCFKKDEEEKISRLMAWHRHASSWVWESSNGCSRAPGGAGAARIIKRGSKIKLTADWIGAL